MVLSTARVESRRGPRGRGRTHRQAAVERQRSDERVPIAADDLVAAGGPAGHRRAWAAFEWSAALLASLAALSLGAVHLGHAGALWRDEASTVWLATLPSLRDVWTWLPYDHCPPGIHLFIRAWWALGWADTDSHLRVLGFCLGLLLPAAFWAASRLMRRGVPVLPLALVAANVTVITTADSFRGYGLGCVTSVLMVAFVWRVAKAPTWANAAWAALAAVLSVQCLYQNAFFVLAACSGGVAACITGRRWRGALLVLAAGAMAAASLIPYVSIVRRSQDWYLLEEYGFSLAGGWNKLVGAIGYPVTAFAWVWVALCLGAAASSLLVLTRHGAEVTLPRRELMTFGAVALCTGVAGFTVFLEVADLPTQPWYYVPLLAFVGVCLDATLPAYHRWARPALSALGVLAVLIGYPSGVRAAEVRQTNIDLLAARVAEEAGPDDYVIVHPWYCGASFARYYHGAAPWTTLPPLADHALHRYDLLKVEMQKEHPIQPVLDRMASTLRGGHRVWLVGGIQLSTTPPRDVHPAPHNPWGWLDREYSVVWGDQAGYLAGTHAEHGVVEGEPAQEGVNPLENLPLVMVYGWRSP
jgi:hypothetical protein